MIVSTIIAGSKPPACGAPLKNGVQPRKLPSNGSRSFCDERPEHEDPPEADDDARDRREHLDQRADHTADAVGASSLRKRPIAIESGAAKISATPDVIAVP